MGDSGKVIDYFDLTIALPQSLHKLMTRWLKDFDKRHGVIERSPRLRGGELQIVSTDLVALTGYVDPAAMNEFDFHRFKALIREAIEQQLLRSVNLDLQAHYKWCLAALASLEFGRHLE